MARQAISVAAPRTERWDASDPASRIVIWHRGRQHPANPAYKSPEGEVCICQGQGVAGDPGNQETPWLVHPYPQIVALIKEGKLVEVRPKDDTHDLQMDADDLRTLDLHARAVKGLESRHVEGVKDLADKVRQSTDPIEWLSSVPGIGRATADDLLEQLQARGLYS